MAGTKLKEALNRLKKGDVIAFGTDTINGIGCLYSSEKGISRIYEMKGREDRKPLILLCSSFEMASSFFSLDDSADRLMRKYMPGALTIVAKPKVLLASQLLLDGYASFRIPARKSVVDLIEYLGQPIASTSLNMSGRPVITERSAARKIFKDLFIANNLSSKVIPSTVVKCENGGFSLLREGALKIVKIKS